MLDPKRMHRIFGTIDAAHKTWDHFVNHHATSWDTIEIQMSEDLTEVLGVQTKFLVKIAKRLNANECYLDGSTYVPDTYRSDARIDITFYCSEMVYERKVGITLPVLTELAHDFTKVILHEYTHANQNDCDHDPGDQIYDLVDPLEVDAYSSELAYDYIRYNHDLTKSDVFDRFHKSTSSEVKSELYHLTALKAEFLEKLVTPK